jgi:hypothetical protein
MKNISLQYQDLQEGKMNRHQFLRNARMMFPNHVTQYNSFEDSIKILKSKGLLNEGNAVKGTPDKAPTYEYPNEETKYMKVVQEPEVDEQDGIYPATTLTDIPKEKMDKKVKDTSDGLEPIKDKDTKNELKKVKIIKVTKQTLKEDEGKFDPKQHQKDDLKKFSDKMRDQVQGGPPKGTNKLKDTIKNMVREMLADMDDDYEEFTADTERNDDGGKPKMSELIGTLVDKFDDFQKSNDIDLENEVKENDLNNFISNYIDKIGYGMNDDYYNFLFYGVQDDLKRLGYKFI